MLKTLLLIAAALLPAIVLCVYVFIKDRVEKEPIGLLVKLLLLGAVCCIPAAIIEEILTWFLNTFFLVLFGQVPTDVTSPLVLNRAYLFIDAFIVVALVEEGVKFLTLNLVTKKNKAFNSLFDGIIYAIFVSLGFATFENVLYVLGGGFSVAATRAVLSVPGHMFFAVMMGYYYSMTHITDKAREMERSLKVKGLIAINNIEFNSSKNTAMSLVVPVLAHGLYDYCCFASSYLAILVVLAFVIFMYIYCFGKIRKMSKADSSDHNYAKALLIRKYPSLMQNINDEL